MRWWRILSLQDQQISTVPRTLGKFSTGLKPKWSVKERRPMMELSFRELLSKIGGRSVEIE